MDDALAADFPSRWFDFEQILSETFVQRVDFQRECRSTNDRALAAGTSATGAAAVQGDAADQSNKTVAGAGEPFLFATDAQTSGRGRGNHHWWAGDGALTFSLRLRPALFGIERSQWPLISLTTAIAVADTLALFAPERTVGLKWPNDVHLDRRKICGILVEPPPGQQDEIVIGIGVNVLNSLADAPAELRSIATSLADEVEAAVSPGDVLVTLLQQLERSIGDLAQSRLNLRERWASQCILTGQPIVLTSGDRQLVGICRGIDLSGAILIESEGVAQPHFGGTVRLLSG